MDNDDAQVGRIVSRRELLALFGSMGAAGAALLAGCSSNDSPAATPTTASGQGGGIVSATSTPASSGGAASPPTAAAASAALPSCVVVPELTEGPYFVDVNLDRSDIRGEPGGGGDREGAPLTLTVNVMQVGSNGCTPLADAKVDIWHCDALGVYSGVTDAGFNTRSLQFLRGFQDTDAAGKAQFTTIYPGWYQGRATHIHFKVRSGNSEFTSQWFFDDTLSDQVHTTGAYASRGAGGRLQNSRDGIFGQSNGQLTLNVTPSGNGYAATFDIGLRL